MTTTYIPQINLSTEQCQAVRIHSLGRKVSPEELKVAVKTGLRYLQLGLSVEAAQREMINLLELYVINSKL